MVISEITGGLGNQLFQYAAGRALADRLGAEFKLDIEHYAGDQRTAAYASFKRNYKLDSFNIRVAVASPDEIFAIRDKRMAKPLGRTLRRIAKRLPGPIRMRAHFGLYVGESPIAYEPAWEQVRGNVYLRGFWQNERFFKPIEAKIRGEFTWRDSAAAQSAADYVEQLRQENGAANRVVAVHVRRGDIAYATEVLKDKTCLGPPVSAKYIADAAARFDRRFIYLVFSDDMDWCQANLKLPNMVFSPGKSDLEDFALMRCCDHFLLSNSTFGWWAAWLSDRPGKSVVAPREWFYQEVAPGFKIRDLIPAEWEVI